MKEKKRSLVEWAMHYRQIIILLTCCLMAFGIFGLADMKKNEFPDFTIRQGIVAAVAPGYTAAEVEEQVAKPLGDYIFSYKEVRKAKTHSTSKDGMVIIQVQLNDELNNKDEFWSKFKHGINDFKAQLPTGVLAIQVMDDFGDTSALLITMESEDKTYRELNDYMDDLRDRLPLETTLALRYGSGAQVGTVWEGDYDIPVVLKSTRSDRADFTHVKDELIPVAGGLANVPLRQVATVEPSWEPGQIVRRNGIIMIDYAEELRREERMSVHDAIYHSAQRRMRPIFLTSAAASMGVIPMILGGSGLWMPMGTVIFYGTLITMFFILTVIPVAYWKALAGSTKRRALRETMEKQ